MAGPSLFATSRVRRATSCSPALASFASRLFCRAAAFGWISRFASRAIEQLHGLVVRGLRLGAGSGRAHLLDGRAELAALGAVERAWVLA